MFPTHGDMIRRGSGGGRRFSYSDIPVQRNHDDNSRSLKSQQDRKVALLLFTCSIYIAEKINREKYATNEYTSQDT